MIKRERHIAFFRDILEIADNVYDHSIGLGVKSHELESHIHDLANCIKGIAQDRIIELEERYSKNPDLDWILSDYLSDQMQEEREIIKTHYLYEDNGGNVNGTRI